MRKTSFGGRRPLTKTQLLPLPADQVCRLSLKHHLALAMLRDGRGDVNSLSTLLNVVALAEQLDADGTVLANSVQFQCAEQALEACITRGEPLMLTATERAAIAPVLLHHDAQLAWVPSHRYIEALERVAVRAIFRQ
ncbi:hypothetical protein WI61_08085 [Burkholderia cepacia]|uniref:hypothetical protein n=1 Tax=Burkholderia cepacia TaxID=292 RepID=UPI0007566A0E|nr:hypothetical protein [Burkholderia cepacia]KVA46788.1 hypothetical protein WI47_21180 [Burkholderia cepacia]KVA51586.1 hypothetical protein WI48_25925 [Burkholderia cepacia]KVA70850.1 hypothetical protein WI49_35400 [Burkholderia cepacia]KVA78910.1 hypothetical protein WI51_27640 [Burkholderia cepacia]KVA78932.1 hypothetical protein WI52_25530 [Burkholderia cepacia]